MFNIDQRSSKPIFQQLVQEIKIAVLKKILLPGEKLPSVRDLATQLTINPNTIQKAYQELERQNITETRQGKGTFINPLYQPEKDEKRMSELKENLTNLIVEANFLGLDKSQIIALVQQILTELNIVETSSGGEKN